MNKFYNVVITPEAENDLSELHHYISYNLLSPENADSYVSDLKSAIIKLDNMPEKFPKVHFQPWRSRGMRFFVVKNHIVYYIISESDTSVYVTNVIYKYRDQKKILDDGYWNNL